jgi:hypothetical protein
VNDSLVQLRRYLKHGLAAVIFTSMLLGGGAAALSILAAAITALSGVYRTQTAVPVERPVDPASGKSAPIDRSTVVATPNQPSLVQGATSSNSTVSSSSSGLDSAGDQVTPLESPLERSLNYGGMALGQQVHQTFGRILSGVLRTLFLDQPADKQNGGP